MATKATERVMSIRLPVPLIAKLHKSAKANERTMAGEIRFALTTYTEGR